MRYLFNAATSGSSKSLLLFLDTYKMDANTPNENGQTALFEAATVDGINRGRGEGRRGGRAGERGRGCEE